MPQWLFLNIDAGTSVAQPGCSDAEDWTLQLAGSSGLHPSRIVLELLETALPSDAQAERWAHELRHRGYLVALDDFGAGHSNFDRVFRIRPHIVKLDRSVTIHASVDRTVRAVMAQMISLLHECGALVLVEGVETSEEADIALDSDADFVQGFWFGRPDEKLRRLSDPIETMRGVWARSSGRADADLDAYRNHVRPYVDALAQARDRLASGDDMQTACSDFLSLGSADLCFLLDAEGVQIGGNAIRRTDEAVMEFAQFSPLSDVRGARWSRRPYFRRAVAAPGQVQLTRPYPTMHTRLMSITLSLAFEVQGSVRVVCGDMLWHADVDRPAFGATVFDDIGAC